MMTMREIMKLFEDTPEEYKQTFGDGSDQLSSFDRPGYVWLLYYDKARKMYDRPELMGVFQKLSSALEHIEDAKVKEAATKRCINLEKQFYRSIPLGWGYSVQHFKVL